MMNNPKIVVIGGGTGSFTLLSDLKNYTENVTALVNMADNGGSTGILRDELGVLPPGDVRQCLVALSDSSKLRDLFNYRFSEGSLDGHSFGNLFISAVEKISDNFEEAVKFAGETLRIRGRVLPVTTADSQLVLVKEDGVKVTGEYDIAHMNFNGKPPMLSLEPRATLTLSGKKAIKDADMVVIAPGNLYGSLAPALLVDGIEEALSKTKAKLTYVCNLVTKPGQTDGFTVIDYAAEIERFIGSSILDFVLYNTKKPPQELMKKYAREGELLIEFSEEDLKKQHYKAVGAAFVADHEVAVLKGDKIAHSRSLIRHDAKMVSQKLMEILKSV